MLMGGGGGGGNCWAIMIHTGNNPWKSKSSKVFMGIFECIT